MQKITFSKVYVRWFFLTLILNLINGFTVKSSFLYSFIMSSLGIFLLICPVYPKGLERRYDKEKCEKIIRAIAVVEIIVSFMMKNNF